LLFARIPNRLVTGTVTLEPGNGAATFSALRTQFHDCSALCDPLAAGQPLSYSELLTAGAKPVASPSELLTDLQPQQQSTITWERLEPVSAAAFAPLFPKPVPTTSRPRPRQHPHVVRHGGGLPIVTVAVIGLLCVLAGGGVLWLRARRRPEENRPPRPPERRRPPQRPARRTHPDSDALLPVIGPGDVVDAALRSGFSPEGYVEIDDCLVRAIWSDSSPPPKPGQTVTTRLVNGALQATSAGVSTSRMER
jgi:hypothetical protein